MVGVSRLLVAFAVAGLLSQPLFADVIPTRRAGDTKESSQKVESRLVELGVTSEAAKEQTRHLSDDQTRYFAATPERIQVVGQGGENWGGQSDNLWWEWVFGILILGAAVGAIAIALND